MNITKMCVSIALAACVGCATQRGVGGSGLVKGEAATSRVTRYTDATRGLEICRPAGHWQLDATDESTPDGLTIPVILRHRESGAQVVLQVAPAIATPTEFAEHLITGFRSKAGVTTS